MYPEAVGPPGTAGVWRQKSSSSPCSRLCAIGGRDVQPCLEHGEVLHRE